MFRTVSGNISVRPQIRSANVSSSISESLDTKISSQIFQIAEKKFRLAAEP